jgi:hypothetical protein
VLAVVAIFAALGVLCGCKEEQPAKSVTPPAQPLPPWIQQAIAEQQVVDGIPGYWVDAPAVDAPVLQVSAVDFIREFKRDEEATKDKYCGQWTEITGPVEDVKPAQYNDYVVLCGLTRGDSCRESIHFNLIDDAPWKKTSVGSAITVRGVLSRETWVCRFDHGTIVSEESNPTREIAATELVKAYLADEAAAKEKYDQTTLICHGTVEFCGEQDGYHRTLLAGEGDTPVKLDYLNISDTEFHKLNAGDEVSVIGRCRFRDKDIYGHALAIDATLLPKADE